MTPRGELSRWNAHVIDVASELLAHALARNVTLRFASGVGVWTKCTAHRTLFEKHCLRFSDLDIAALSRERDQVLKVLADLGFDFPAEDVEQTPYSSRVILHRRGSNSQEGLECDVFFDRFEFDHPIYFANEISSDYPTLPPTILALQGLQIKHLSWKDLVHLAMLFGSCQLSDEETPETISIPNIRASATANWGTYKTFQKSLALLESLLPANQLCADAETLECLRIRTTMLRIALAAAPKSARWHVQRVLSAIIPDHSRVSDERRA